MRNAKTQERWDNYLYDFLIKNEKDFEYHEKNGNKVVIWDKKRNLGMRFSKRLTKNEMKDLHYFNSVRTSFLRYYKNNPKHELYPEKPSQGKNFKNIKNLVDGEIFNATDICHCYWRIAYLEKYISKQLYDKLVVPEYKHLRNHALACMTSVKNIDYYKGGKFFERKTIINNTLCELYNNIRNKAYFYMNECEKLLGKDFFKYRTDCVYYAISRREEVESYLEKNNLIFRTEECTYIGDNKFISEDGIREF